MKLEGNLVSILSFVQYKDFLTFIDFDFMDVVSMAVQVGTGVLRRRWRR
jgi:hypothetical protein